MLFRFFSIEYEPMCSRFCCAKQICAFKFFVHARMSKCCLGVCPESRRIHNCMYDDGTGSVQSWFVPTCFTWLKWLRAEDLISRIHTCMHIEARVAPLRGWIQRLSYIYTCIAYQGKNGSAQKLYSACIHACMYCEARMGLCPALVHGACIAFPSPLGIQWEMRTTIKSEAWTVHFGNLKTGASWHEKLQLLDLCSDVT